MLQALRRLFNRNTAAYWNEVYRFGIGEAGTENAGRHMERMARLLEDRERILDFGGGAGVAIAALARTLSGRRFCLVDHSEEAIRLATERLGASDTRGNTFEYAGRLDDTRAEFDAILCLEVLEHLSHYREILDQLWRRLRPGGLLLLSVPVKGWRDGHREHVNKFTVDSMFRILLNYSDWVQISPRSFSRKGALSTAFFAVRKESAAGG